ncbi:MAG: hypothetical protein SOW55_02070 [Bacilli bacterium]|nr:hypothetical protein [Bacillales bacterium]MDY2574755.1 hypothetical protein [Bacilli bacterium]
MQEWLIILLCCLGGIIALWLLLIVVVLILLFVLKNKIGRNKVSINIILAQKFDVANVLAKFLLENGIELPSEVKDEFNITDKPNFNSFTTFERKTVGKRINECTNTLKEIADNSFLKDNKRYITLSDSIDDVEKQYRHMILTYNNNVWAYNYWVGFIPFRPISKIFKIQKKKQINENSKEIK